MNKKLKFTTIRNKFLRSRQKIKNNYKCWKFYTERNKKWKDRKGSSRETATNCIAISKNDQENSGKLE